MQKDIPYTPDKGHDDPEKPVLLVQKQIVKFPGQHIRVFDSKMRLLAMAHAMPFRLREKLGIYSDNNKKNLIAYAQTKKIIDFNVTFTITEPESGEVLGSIRRKGLTSELLRDSWMVFSAAGEHIATLQEPNIKFSLVRRWILTFLPQTYALVLEDKSASLLIKQTWTPLILRFKVYSKEYEKFTKVIPQKQLATILCTIAAIEGRE
jgi:hypothetical protein